MGPWEPGWEGRDGCCGCSPVCPGESCSPVYPGSGGEQGLGRAAAPLWTDTWACVRTGTPQPAEILARELWVRGCLVCLWHDMETVPCYYFCPAGFRAAVWDLGRVNTQLTHSVLRGAGGHCAPVWNKPGPGRDPGPCVCQLSGSRGDSLGAREWHRAQGSGPASPSCWLLPRAAGAVLSQEQHLTWKVDSSESREKIL